MTETELLAAISEARLDGEGVSVQELVAVTGWGQDRVRRMLKTAIAAGRIRVTRKTVLDMANRPQIIPSYVKV